VLNGFADWGGAMILWELTGFASQKNSFGEKPGCRRGKLDAKMQVGVAATAVFSGVIIDPIRL
jgi:hypothetical protein